MPKFFSTFDHTIPSIFMHITIRFGVFVALLSFLLSSFETSPPVEMVKLVIAILARIGHHFRRSRPIGGYKKKEIACV
jgi:hypothetical protein